MKASNLLDKLRSLPQFIDGSSNGSMWQLADAQVTEEGATTVFVRLADVIALLHVEEPYYLPLGRGSEELAKLVKSNGWNVGTALDGIFDDLYSAGDSPGREYSLKAPEDSPEGFILLGRGSRELELLALKNKWDLHRVRSNNAVSDIGHYCGDSSSNRYCVKGPTT